MTPDRWRQVEAYYQAACDGGDGELADAPEDVRHEVERMLAQRSSGICASLTSAIDRKNWSLDSRNAARALSRSSFVMLGSAALITPEATIKVALRKASFIRRECNMNP